MREQTDMRVVVVRDGEEEGVFHVVSEEKKMLSQKAIFPPLSFNNETGKPRRERRGRTKRKPHDIEQRKVKC